MIGNCGGAERNYLKCPRYARLARRGAAFHSKTAPLSNEHHPFPHTSSRGYGVTTTVSLVESPALPSLSVTVSCTLYVPAAA